MTATLLEPRRHAALERLAPPAQPFVPRAPCHTLAGGSRVPAANCRNKAKAMETEGTTERLLGKIDDPQARQELFALIYRDLHARARKILAAHQNPSLNATMLVHETYLKLIDAPLSAQNKGHFFAVAAQAMRQIMVDHARHRLAQKRDQHLRASLDEDIPHPDALRLPELLGLDQALRQLQAEDRELADLVELHFFGGLSFTEIAQIRGVSLSTVERNWRTARAMLYRSMA